MLERSVEQLQSLTFPFLRPRIACLVAERMIAQAIMSNLPIMTVGFCKYSRGRQDASNGKERRMR